MFNILQILLDEPRDNWQRILISRTVQQRSLSCKQLTKTFGSKVLLLSTHQHQSTVVSLLIKQDSASKTSIHASCSLLGEWAHTHTMSLYQQTTCKVQERSIHYTQSRYSATRFTSDHIPAPLGWCRGISKTRLCTPGDGLLGHSPPPRPVSTAPVVPAPPPG